MLVCGEYNLIDVLSTGEVELRRELIVVNDPSWNVTGIRCATETSTSARYLWARISPLLIGGDHPFTTTAFPHRRFRHSYLFKHNWADAENPSPLTGKKVSL
jgi:hypothetical protein